MNPSSVIPTASDPRFWSRVDQSAGAAGCWPWTGHRLPKGYGMVNRAAFRHAMGTHRYAWALTHGPIPEGLLVLHRCDNPPCCNPLHLFLGTAADNSRDMVNKGRRVGPRLAGESNPNARLTDAEVALLRSQLPGPRGTQARLAREFGVSPTLVSRIAQGTHR